MLSSSRLAPPDPGWTFGAPAVADDDQTAWLVTFSDLVLQLFAFVLVSVVLGGSARLPAAPALPVAAPPAPAVTMPAVPAAAEPPAAAPTAAPTPTDVRPPSDAEDAGRRAAALAGYLRELAGRGDGVTVTAGDGDVVLTLADTITFPSGSADLLGSAVPILAAIRTLVASLPDFAVHVEGHTDDVHIHTTAYPSNLELSLARAARVARELSADDPDLAGRTAAAGFGEHHPVASNADDAGRARNRRVEIRLVPRSSS